MAILPAEIRDASGNKLSEVVVESRQCLKCGKALTTRAGRQVVCHVMNGTAYGPDDQPVRRPTLYLHLKCAEQLADELTAEVLAAERYNNACPN